MTPLRLNLFVVATLTAVLGMALLVLPTRAEECRGTVGKASYYCCEHNGRTTRHGEIFNENEMTAAHNSLPYNAVVRVTNLDNGKSVQVRITDTGGFGKYGRLIDLSKAAFAKIAPTRSGIIRRACIERIR